MYVSDLSWEDKEVVLRLLFAKMNGLKRRKTQPAHSQGHHSKQTGASSNVPVFISEGAINGIDGGGDGDSHIDMSHFIDAFEVPLDAGVGLEGADDVAPGGINGSSIGIYGGYNLSRANMA